MRKKAVPEVQGEFFRNATKTGDEMIFKRANGTFGGVAAVDGWWRKLEVYIFGGKEVLEKAGGFIVQTLEPRTQSGFAESGVKSLKGGKNSGCLTVFERLYEDGVAVVVVEYHDIVIAGAGWAQELAGLVGVDLSQGLHERCKA